MCVVFSLARLMPLALSWACHWAVTEVSTLAIERCRNHTHLILCKKATSCTHHIRTHARQPLTTPDQPRHNRPGLVQFNQNIFILYCGSFAPFEITCTSCGKYCFTSHTLRVANWRSTFAFTHSVASLDCECRNTNECQPKRPANCERCCLW